MTRRFALALVALAALALAPACAPPARSDAASPDVSPADVPSLSSRWWEEPDACPSGTALRRDAPAPGPPDACGAPFCEVWCARADGVRHGPVTGWYGGRGEKHHEGMFRDGEKHGRWIVWYLGGGPADDGAWVAGREDGLWTQWWEGGALYRTVEFRDGAVVALTPYRDGQPLPTERATVEGQGLVEPLSTTDTPARDAPPAERREPTSLDYLEAVLAELPEAYRELSEVTYEYVDVPQGHFAIGAVRVLAPAAAMAGVTAEEREARACRVKQRLGLDCACEQVVIGPAEDYAWHSWPDKRVVPVTVRFLLGC